MISRPQRARIELRGAGEAFGSDDDRVGGAEPAAVDPRLRDASPGRVGRLPVQVLLSEEPAEGFADEPVVLLESEHLRHVEEWGGAAPPRDSGEMSSSVMYR